MKENIQYAFTCSCQSKFIDWPFCNSIVAIYLNWLKHWRTNEQKNRHAHINAWSWSKLGMHYILSLIPSKIYCENTRAILGVHNWNWLCVVGFEWRVFPSFLSHLNQTSMSRFHQVEATTPWMSSKGNFGAHRDAVQINCIQFLVRLESLSLILWILLFFANVLSMERKCGLNRSVTNAHFIVIRETTQTYYYTIYV